MNVYSTRRKVREDKLALSKPEQLFIWVFFEIFSPLLQTFSFYVSTRKILSFFTILLSILVGDNALLRTVFVVRN